MPGRILILDDAATNRIVLKVKLSSALYEVSQAASAAEAFDLMRVSRPDMIILGTDLRDMSGVQFCETMQSNAEAATVPLIMVSGQEDEVTRLAALRAGADDFLVKPLDELALLARVRSLLRAAATSQELRRRDATARELGFAEAQAEFQGPARIAILANSPEIATAWRSRLGALSGDLIEVMSREHALEVSPGGAAPDAFVIEANLGGEAGGLQLMSELRSREATRHAAVIVLHDARDLNMTVMALDLGANDLIAKGSSADELALRLRAQLKRKSEADRLRETLDDGLRLAALDPLTGLYNRRYALPHLERVAARARASGQSFAVMMLDIDRFKEVNDNWGHAAGDTVLRELARRLQQNLRSIDMLARIGGEEFMIVLPDTSLPEAQHVAERLRRVAAGQPVPLPSGKGDLSVTVSIGLAMGQPSQGRHRRTDWLIEDADRALYLAKNDGRNLVTLGRSAA